MATTSAEDRLELIRDALFPEEEDYCGICDGPCCDGETSLDPEDGLVGGVITDAVSASFVRLTEIVEEGSTEDALVAVNILLGNLIALSDRVR